MSRHRASRRPIEIELKYRVVDLAAARSLPRRRRHRRVRGDVSRVRSTQVEDRYIDTADGALARGRLRGPAPPDRQGDDGRGQVAGPAERRRRRHRREELEGPADRTARPRDWPASDARSLILELCGDAPLVEVVTIRQLRRKRILDATATRGRAQPRRGRRRRRSRVVGRFVELEVELVKGDEARLAGAGRRARGGPGLAPATLEAQLALRRSPPRSRSRAGAGARAGRRRGDGAGEAGVPSDRRRRRPSGGRARPSTEAVERIGRRSRASARPRPTPAEADRRRRRRDRAARDDAASRGAARSRPTAPSRGRCRRPPGTPSRSPPELTSDADDASEPPRTPARHRTPTLARRSSSSARRRASSPTTTSPRPAARSSASTSPG